MLLKVIACILIFICHYHINAEELTTTTTTKKPPTEATAIEIAVILSGILAVSTVSVLIVLLPTIIYYNRQGKEESDPTIVIN